MRAATLEHNRLLADRTLQLAADPTRTYVPPPALDRVPYLDFAPLQNSAAQFADACNAFEKARAAAEAAGLAGAERQKLDDFLRHFEQRMLLDPGLPGRPWYRHAIYAPGLYTGYGVKTLPSIREAIETRHWDDADAQIEVISKLLDAARGAVEAMTQELAPAQS
jgi:N-acetylated-alpha-linked acidic dipeptidase